MSGERPNEREQGDRQQADGGREQQSGRQTRQGTQSGQRQQAGRPTQRQRGGDTRARQRPAGSAGESVTDILGEASGKRFLLYIVGVFTAVGAGYGIGLLLLDAVASSAGAFFGAFGLIVAVLAAPIVSMATGLLTGLRLRASSTEAALVSGVGALAGFLVMLVVLVVFAALVAEGGGSGTGGDVESGGSLSDFFGPLLAFGTGVALTGAATTYVVKRIEI